MPNWDTFYYNYSGTSTSYVHLTSAHIQQQWEEYQEECRQKERIMEQMMREAEEQQYQKQLRQEDIKKYPLFFWRETCKPIEEEK